MKKRCVVLLLCGGFVCPAQIPLRGEILASPGTNYSELSVQIETLGSTVTEQHVTVESDGRFTFRDVPPGTYRLRILDAVGDEITSESLNVLPGNVSVSVHLPERKIERPSGASVSVERLRHQPSKPALRAFMQAQKLSEANAHEHAVAALEKAVALDPQFIEAHGNLGVQYALLKRYERAADEFRQAIALDPATGQHQSNLALVLLNLRQSVEAEQWARHGVELDRANAKAHYALGCVLVRRPETRPAGIQELQLAAREFPKAHWTLAEVYRATGEKDLAKEEMQRYLAADPTASKPDVETWISSLR